MNTATAVIIVIVCMFFSFLCGVFSTKRHRAGVLYATRGKDGNTELYLQCFEDPRFLKDKDIVTFEVMLVLEGEDASQTKHS